MIHASFVENLVGAGYPVIAFRTGSWLGLVVSVFFLVTKQKFEYIA